MKKLMLLVSVVALLAIATVGVKVASDRYHDHQKQKQAQAPKTVPLSQFQALETTTSGELTSLQTDNGRLLAECQKGSAAYALLTPVQKAKTPAPVCQ